MSGGRVGAVGGDTSVINTEVDEDRKQLRLEAAADAKSQKQQDAIDGIVKEFRTNVPGTIPPLSGESYAGLVKDVITKVASWPTHSAENMVGAWGDAKNNNANKSITDQVTMFLPLTGGSKDAAKLLAHRSYDSQDAKSVEKFKAMGTALFALNKDGINPTEKASRFIAISKDALDADNLSPEKQTEIIADLLDREGGSLNPSQREAFAAVIANLPNGKSAGELATKIYSIDKDAGKTTQDANKLAAISDHLKESRQGDLNPETKELHQELIGDLIHSGGVDYKTAQLAAKVLDHVPADKKADAIKFALDLTKKENPLQGFQDSTDPAKQVVAKAAVDLLKENGMDVDQTSRAMNAIMDSDGKVNYGKLSGTIAGLVRAGAPAEAMQVAAERYSKVAGIDLLGVFKGYAESKLSEAVYRDIPSWQPGSSNGSDSHDGMNARFNNEYWSAEQNLRANEKELGMLHGLLKASGDLDKNQVYGASQADLQSLNGLKTVSASILDTTSASRITLDRDRSANADGKFEVFTDKANGQKFYKLTQTDGSARYAVNTKDNEWAFLQGNELSSGGKSYAETIGSLNKKIDQAKRPDVLAKIEKTKKSEYDYYQTRLGEVAIYKGDNANYPNLIYAKDQDGHYVQVEDPVQIAKYKKAEESWKLKVNHNAETRDIGENTSSYRVYTTNGGTEVAVGIGAKTKGLTYIKSTKGDWQPSNPPSNQVVSTTNYTSQSSSYANTSSTSPLTNQPNPRPRFGRIYQR